MDRKTNKRLIALLMVLILIATMLGCNASNMIVDSSELEAEETATTHSGCIQSCRSDGLEDCSKLCEP